MTRRELFRKTRQLLAGDLLIWAMLEILFLSALLVVLALGGSGASGRGSPGGVFLMLLLPAPMILLETVLYHWKLLLDLLFLSVSDFSGNVTQVSRTQNRRCDDDTFALYAEGPSGRSETFFLFGELKKAHQGELTEARFWGSFPFGPVSFCYLKRSRYIVALYQWPRREEPAGGRKKKRKARIHKAKEL